MKFFENNFSPFISQELVFLNKIFAVIGQKKLKQITTGTILRLKNACVFLAQFSSLMIFPTSLNADAFSKVCKIILWILFSFSKNLQNKKHQKTCYVYANTLVKIAKPSKDRG